MDFNLSEIEKYREHNQLEVKDARGGFPDSFWETYSSFANTDGGIIILGIKENKDGSLYVVGLGNIEKTYKDFWNMVNNRQKISSNILTEKAVTKEKVEGKDILVFRIPRVERAARPVYKGMDPRQGTYRRYHEGDYLCSAEEIALMFRDADPKSQDTKVLVDMDFSVFCPETIKSYRQMFKTSHPDHFWNNVDDELFLRNLGAISISTDGRFHPTAAGLLMFGYEYEIVREFPQYFLDYQENRQVGETRWTDRIVSTSGDWSGNVFDFIIKIVNRLGADLKTPFVLRGMQRVDDTPVHKILREATTNSMVHADFYGRRGIVISKTGNDFKFSNPGSMRISALAAIEGSYSDPRNNTMLKMLSLVKLGERAGSGVSGIFHTWSTVYHTRPTIEELHEDKVDRTVLILDTNGNPQDIKAMLSLYDSYDGIIGDQSSISKVLSVKNDTQNDTLPPSATQDGTQNDTLPLSATQDGTQNDTLPLSNTRDDTPKPITNKDYKIAVFIQELVEVVTAEPTISRQKLANKYGLSLRTMARYLKMARVKWIGPTIGGAWKVPES